MDALETVTDRELLERWRAGDEAAGEALVRPHHASVDRFFTHKVGVHGEDLTQDTFLGLLEGLPRFRGEASFRTLLFAIARHKLIDFLRGQARDNRRFDPAEVSVVAWSRSPLSLLEIHERNKLLVAALRQLPFDTQVMLELHYWEKLSTCEIAEVLDIPQNTVKTRMRRGRLRLDEQMRALAESPVQLETTRRGLGGWLRELQRETRQESDQSTKG